MKNKSLVKGLKAGFLSLLGFFVFSCYLFKNFLPSTWEQAALAALPLSLFFAFIMFLVVWRTGSVFGELEDSLIEKLSNPTIHQEIKILELKNKDESCKGK
ncbi:MAG: hypothetical protein V4504_02160 [Patescibacteria group bacterium]